MTSTHHRCRSHAHPACLVAAVVSNVTPPFRRESTGCSTNCSFVVQIHLCIQRRVRHERSSWSMFLSRWFHRASILLAKNWDRWIWVNGRKRRRRVTKHDGRCIFHWIRSRNRKQRCGRNNIMHAIIAQSVLVHWKPYVRIRRTTASNFVVPNWSNESSIRMAVNQRSVWIIGKNRIWVCWWFDFFR